MKTISFLYSISIRKFPKRAVILADDSLGTVEEDVDEEETRANEPSLNIIKNSTLTNLIWWWPYGRAFREMRGIPESAILQLLKDYGFNFSNNFILNHKQVEQPDSLLENYIEAQITISDEKYNELCQRYGLIKTL